MIHTLVGTNIKSSNWKEFSIACRDYFNTKQQIFKLHEHQLILAKKWNYFHFNDNKIKQLEEYTKQLQMLLN